MENLQITLNGDVQIASTDSLLELLKDNGWSAEKVVIELNGVIISPEQFQQTMLHAGDALEILQFVGGG